MHIWNHSLVDSRSGATRSRHSKVRLRRAMRFSALLLILAVIMVALLPGRSHRALVWAQGSVVKSPGPMGLGPAQKFANAKQRIISPGDETNLTMAMSPQQNRRRRGPRLPLAPVRLRTFNAHA